MSQSLVLDSVLKMTPRMTGQCPSGSTRLRKSRLTSLAFHVPAFSSWVSLTGYSFSAPSSSRVPGNAPTWLLTISLGWPLTLHLLDHKINPGLWSELLQDCVYPLVRLCPGFHHAFQSIISLSCTYRWSKPFISETMLGKAKLYCK